MFLFFAGIAGAQVSINDNGSPPDSSAMLDVNSTNKGVLVPRMSQPQISAISNPANGLIVYNTTDSKMYIYVAGVNAWKKVSYGTGTLSRPFLCGDTITRYHVADTIAPVTKTVTYSTVSGIPGEPSKCWISSNLGASQQATYYFGSDEASAGWYWQFNRMQGYKHDGIDRTPDSAWIDPIVESSNWLAANDPYSLELGSPWRIPTSSEWTNVDAAGSWTYYLGPWNSELKMHRAGDLLNSDGSLANRGSTGYYWSGTQGGSANASFLNFTSGSCDVSNLSKANGFSVRCVR